MTTNEKQLQKQESTDLQSVERTRSGKVFLPAVDIFETKNEMKLLADMPGVDQKSINITVDKNVLLIEANVDATPDEEFKLEYREYETGDYQRSFTLSDNVDKDNISAKYVNGVLELVLPKVEEAKPKKIEVK